jgi:hypothetical protein
MNIGSIGKALAGQAIESTKNAVLAPAKPAESGQTQKSTPPATPDIGALILGQIQAMQRPMKEDQELAVLVRAGDDMLRVHEVFVPNNQVLVFAGYDSHGAVTRLISPADEVQVVCKVISVQPGASPLRVNILTPKPRPEPAA